MPPIRQRAASTNKLAGSTIKGGSVPQWTDSQNNVARQLMMYYLSAGWSKAGASGMIGNQMQESSLNPGEAGGYLSQWLGSRLANLQSYAANLGLPVTSVEAQAKFTVHEVRSNYQALDKYLQTATNPGQAAVQISNVYERPAAWAANNPARAQYANQAYTGITGASGMPADGSLQGGNSQGGSNSAPSSVLDLLTSPVETLGGWLASIVVGVIKDTAIGIGDTILLPFVHWQERSIMAYYTVMFGTQSWPMIPWTACFWGLGYWLLFTDPNEGLVSLKPAPVRNSRLGSHVRHLQSIPARRELIKPKDISRRTPTKPKPVLSSAGVRQVRTLRTTRTQTVKVTGDSLHTGDSDNGRGTDFTPAPAGRPRKAAAKAAVAHQGNRAGSAPLPDSTGVTRGSTEESGTRRGETRRRRVSRDSTQRGRG